MSQHVLVFSVWPSSSHPDRFLVDIVTEADRQGQEGLLAQAYEGSQLKKVSGAGCVQHEYPR